MSEWVQKYKQTVLNDLYEENMRDALKTKNDAQGGGRYDSTLRLQFKNALKDFRRAKKKFFQRFNKLSPEKQESEADAQMGYDA